MKAGGFAKEFNHRRQRDKKTVWDKPNQVEYKRNDSPHGAEQEPDKSDDHEGKNM
jgi:hypothetical protein